MWCTDNFGNRIINEGEGLIYVQGDNKTQVPITRQEQNTRQTYYKDIYIVGFEYYNNDNIILSADGENVNIEPYTQGTSSANTSDIKLNINYKIYYNDGTIKENEGADIQLLTSTGKVSKTNKIKVSVKSASEPHKYKNKDIEDIIKIKDPSEYDLIKDEQIFNIPIYQYGYSKTIEISNLYFDVYNIPKEGISELNMYNISDYITNIKYNNLRSEGEYELISGNKLEDVYLELISYKFMNNNGLETNIIEENNSGYK